MPRAGLSAERVVERAAQIVDEHGLEALSLSRLAADLGVAPPSLYKHVAGMDDLVRGVSVRAVEELADRLAASVMGLAGRDALSALAEAYRAFAHEHPGLYPMTQAPVKMPGGESDPMRSMAARRTVDIVTAALAGYGIPDERVVDAVRMTRASPCSLTPWTWPWLLWLDSRTTPRISENERISRLNGWLGGAATA